MTNILRISEAASLGMHTAVLLAGDPERLFTVGEVATLLGASEAHLSKVLQRLGHIGIVRSVRGPRGGFALVRPGGEVTLLEVYEAIEGPLPESACLLGRPVCQGSACVLGGLIASINQQVRGYLSQTTLAELTGVYEEAKK